MALEPSDDCQVVIVDAPGSDCARPFKLCIASECPDNLIRVSTRNRSGSRCMRDLMGATQAEIAYELGLAPQVVARIEAGALIKLRRAAASFEP